MTLYQFNLLNDNQKAEIVWNSVCIGGREVGNHRILLYQVHSFYVEIYYNHTCNKIEKIRSFSSIDQLRPYLDKINITGII